MIPSKSPQRFGDLVRGVDGVVGVYPAEGALAAIPAAVVAAVRGDGPSDDVAVTDEAVSTRIAVAASERSPDIARRVADVLLAAAAPGQRVRVRVARVG